MPAAYKESLGSLQPTVTTDSLEIEHVNKLQPARDLKQDAAISFDGNSSYNSLVGLPALFDFTTDATISGDLTD